METEKFEVPKSGDEQTTLQRDLLALVSYLVIKCEYDDAKLVAQAIERIDKQALVLRTLFPEKVPGQYFICGASDDCDVNGLPTFLHICPAYGADINATQIYKRCDLP